MAKRYQVTPMLRLANGIMVRLMRWGVSLPGLALLTVQGRRSGRPHTVPVQPVEHDCKRWLVSPYGETNWVKNARLTGKADLLYGGRSHTVRLHEADAATAAPVLKVYVNRATIVRPYFDASPESPLEAFAAEAKQHPVFEIEAP